MDPVDIFCFFSQL